MEEKTLTVKLLKYRLKGIAKILDWYSEIGYITIDPVDLDNIPKEEELINNLNDAGFGCQKILGGYVDIYEVYEGNVERLSEKNDILVGDITREEIP